MEAFGAEATVLYDNYLKTLNDRAVEAFKKIDAPTNLDFGPEAERAVYTWLRQTLPAKYGVCRGYIVNEAGDKAGDDLILFDPVNFPSLRAEGAPTFDRKEKIPVQAAYGYLEVKNVLSLEAGGEGEVGQTLAKAASQVAAAKRLILTRAPFRKPGGIRWQRIGCPERDDWPFGAIICGGVRPKKGQPVIEDPDEVAVRVGAALRQMQIPKADLPNLIVAGPKAVIHPVADLPTQGGGTVRQPVAFTTKDCEFASIGFAGKEEDQIAFGFGLAFMLHALDQLMLPDFEWFPLLRDACIAGNRVNKPTVK